MVLRLAPFTMSYVYRFSFVYIGSTLSNEDGIQSFLSLSALNLTSDSEILETVYNIFHSLPNQMILRPLVVIHLFYVTMNNEDEMK